MEIIDSLLPRSLAPRNWRPGRGGEPYAIDAIVIHVSEGDIASARSWFNDPRAQVSAHYIVRKDGVIEQFVREEDRAYHAGQVIHPTSALTIARKPYTPNSWAIGIEHEGDGTHELTDAQRASSLDLIRDIASRYHFPLDREHVIGHHEVKATKSCPGAISVDRLVEEAQSAADYPRIVYSPSLQSYLVVTRYVSDDEWYFLPIDKVRGGARAGAKLSQMPLHP